MPKQKTHSGAKKRFKVTGTGKARISFAEVALDRARDYAAEDADITLRLHHALQPQLLASRDAGGNFDRDLALLLHAARALHRDGRFTVGGRLGDSQPIADCQMTDRQKDSGGDQASHRRLPVGCRLCPADTRRLYGLAGRANRHFTFFFTQSSITLAIAVSSL